jgi:predicted ATP-grasp superfamily ATP-dependent carboligase
VSPASAGPRRGPARTGALVLGAGIRALGIARSLGRRGVPVTLLGEPTDSMARWSRHVTHYLRWPSSEQRRLSVLTQLAGAGYAGWMLFPTDDDVAGLVARHRAELASHYRVLSSAWDVVERVSDKRRTYELAAELGIPHPRTHVPVDAEDLRRTPIELPAILKPAMKTAANAFTDAKAWRADDLERLQELYDEAVLLVPREHVMVQELVPGDGRQQLSFAALSMDGEVLAGLTVQRTRQYPVDFGRSSSYVQTVTDPEIERLSRRLLSCLRFTGLVELEFKRDCAGRPRLLDVNPRVWTWHSIGRRAGVDFPYLAWRAAHGDRPAEPRARTGVRWVRPATDVFAARAAVHEGTLSWPRYVRQLLPPTELAPWLLSDPLPVLADIPLLAVRTGRRLQTHRASAREVRAARERAKAALPAAALLGRGRG